MVYYHVPILKSYLGVYPHYKTHFFAPLLHRTIMDNPSSTDRLSARHGVIDNLCLGAKHQRDWNMGFYQ